MLVLQESPRVAILMKDLVIYMTQGPKPANHPSVLHFDETRKFVHRSKLQWQQLIDLELSIHDQQFDHNPVKAPCECRACIGTGCLFYGTQSDNAVTGAHHEHQFKKKKKGWQYSCPGQIKCPMCQKYNLYRIKKASAREVANTQPPAVAVAVAPGPGSASAAQTPRKSKRAIVMKRQTNLTKQ